MTATYPEDERNRYRQIYVGRAIYRMLIESLLASTRESSMPPLFNFFLILFYLYKGHPPRDLSFFIVFYATDGVRLFTELDKYPFVDFFVTTASFFTNDRLIRMYL